MTSGTPARDGVSNYAGVTATTRQLLQYWSNRDRLSGFSCPESSPFSLTSTTEHGPPDPKPFWLNSEQLEFGDGMSDDFRRIAAREIDEFKAEYRDRYPERDVEKIADEELLREVMNTVGKSGRRGEQIRCVVPVSMLTEGWDANTVTHILGIRAFGTQLLCEQVVGCALRRTSWALDEKEHFYPEYAEVYGVPILFYSLARRSCATTV